MMQKWGEEGKELEFLRDLEILSVEVIVEWSELRAQEGGS